MSETQNLVALSFTTAELEEVNAAFTAQYSTGGDKTLNKFLKSICLGQIRNQEMKE